MRLQDVLKEREQEIAHLEISLKEKEVLTLSTSNLQTTISPGTADDVDSPSTFLSPRTINQFDEIKSVLQNGSDGADVTANPESDESLDRLNELMRFVITRPSAWQFLMIFTGRWLKRNRSIARPLKRSMRS
jgi:hypothetical protein